MNLDIKQNKVHIYNVDINGKNGTWLWDFGTFTLVGNKKYPMSSLKNMIPFISMSKNIDASYINNKKPDKIKEVDIYLGDYIAYVETEPENATHMVSSNNILYNIIESSAFDNNNEEYIIIKENSNYNNKKKLYNKNELKNFIPVLEII